MIEICLFGSARVYDDHHGVVLTEFQGVKPRQVLQILALADGHPVAKELLADQLWQGQPPLSWVSTIEGYISLLRRGLQAGVAARESVVQTRGGGYCLDRERITVDLARFDRLVARAEQEQDPGTALCGLREALALVRGEVLEGERNAAWIAEARSRYRLRVHRAVIMAGRLALTTGSIHEAVRLGQWACELDALSEDGWAVVIEAYWRDGRRADALRSFGSIQHQLDRELGVLPCRSLRHLHAAVLRDDRSDLSA